MGYRTVTNGGSGEDGICGVVITLFGVFYFVVMKLTRAEGGITFAGNILDLVEFQVAEFCGIAIDDAKTDNATRRENQVASITAYEWKILEG